MISTTQTNHERVNALLHQWQQGSTGAYHRVMDILHEDLVRIAHRQFGSERHNHTLETNDLVNQLYLKLLKSNGHNWQERKHFLNAAARCMRQILIDHARKWQHCPSGRHKVPLEGNNAVQANFMEQALCIDELLEKLETISQQSANIANMKLVLGMTLNEIAEALDLEINCVKRDWTFIKKFMLEVLRKKNPSPQTF